MGQISEAGLYSECDLEQINRSAISGTHGDHHSSLDTEVKGHWNNFSEGALIDSSLRADFHL